MNQEPHPPTRHGHTAGPWTIHTKLTACENDRGWCINAGDVWIADSSPVCYDDSGDASPEGLANAQLIAAAPQMLEALTQILPWLEAWGRRGHFSTEAIRSAIASATGATTQGRG